MLCMPDEERAATNELVRPLRGLHRLEWSEDESVNFALSHGRWIGLLRASGFEVEGLVELWPGEGATSDFPYATAEWAAPVADRGGLDRPQSGLRASAGETGMGLRQPGVKTSTMSLTERPAARPPPITYHLPSTTADASPWRFVGRSGARDHVIVPRSSASCCG